MKTVTAFLMMFMISTAVFAQDPVVIEEVAVSPDSASVTVGGQYTFTASVTDTSGAVIDTTAVWSAEGGIGTIDSSGVFTSSTVGAGTVIATVGDFADTAAVEVVEAEPAPVVLAEVVISPDSASVTVAGQYTFTASVADTSGAVIDTTAVWSAEGGIGTIDSSGVFTSSAVGTGTVIATVGDVADTAYVEVVSDEPDEPVAASVTIFPPDHSIVVGDSIQFLAEVEDETGEDIDAEVSWSVVDSAIGTIDENGLFISSGIGETYIIAAVGDLADTASVNVDEEEKALPEETNTISVRRIKADGKVTKFGSYILEGDTLTVGGIPSPLNFMNGTKILFPEGSIPEDITLTFKIPEFAKIQGKEVDFGDGIITGVTFEVSVDGEAVHPYVFGTPLEVTIPFKRGLLGKLGIEPKDLGMYYVTDDGELVEEGITDIALDLDSNTITGIVEHFSDIVIAPKQEQDGEGGDGKEDQTVAVYPRKQTVAVGETIQFQAQVEDLTGVIEDSELTWSVVDPAVGTIDETGLFVAVAVGETEVVAVAGADSGFAEVEVEEIVTYAPGINTVNLQRLHPDGKITQFGAVFAEGDTVTIAGIPRPLNFMNGTKLIFEEGTLGEDIVLTFKIPSIGRIENDEVVFEESVNSAVSFEVSIGGEAQHPYYFDEPIQLTMPYKKGLLDNLGITPYDLGMYFVSDDGELVEEGITNIAVNEEENTITGTVEHFSEIVLASTTEEGTAVEDEAAPNAYVLSPNYPNPFNPTTTIGYTIPEAGRVVVAVHNALGQHIRTLVDGTMPAGQYRAVWDGRDDSGNLVSNGVYIYRLKAGTVSKARKMLFMK